MRWSSNDFGIIVAMVLSLLPRKGWAIACYECVTLEDPACADPFNPWKFNPVICKGDGSDGEVKCASQKEHSSSIVRGCYTGGQIPSLNWTNGCRDWTNDVGYTALYCFCDKDMCNASKRTCTVTEHFLLALVMAWKLLMAM
ncbi:UPAR/Ly6 domain-containing protein qvr-like [Lineus longissimus]|uniref:UPAR/Ly6 domain-containing protein qvr-like n=1 Tax=Lineus longissimus TaxID=88925 RepID=UPI00315D242A